METDKLLHLLVGAVIAFSLGYILPVWIAFAAACAAGALKEVWDYYHQGAHTPDTKDFLATALGGLLAVVFILLTTALKA